MASWLSSLDAVLRLHSAAVLLTVVLATAAAFSGVASYYLSRRAAALSAEATARRLEQARVDALEGARVRIDADRSKLEESQRLLEVAEERADGFLERIESLERQLAQGADRPAPTPAAPKRPAEISAPATGAGPVSAEKCARLKQLLAGRASGAITLVAIAKDSESKAAARRLASALTASEWTPEVIEAYFPTRPDGLVFVVHGREAIPERQYALAQAMAEAGMLTLPVKMIVNPSRPAGFLGLLVGTPGG